MRDNVLGITDKGKRISENGVNIRNKGYKILENEVSNQYGVSHY